MGAVHPLKISGHEAAQLELYQDSRHLQVPNERPDFSFSPRCYFRQKKVQTGSGELGHTLSLAKQLVQIQNLKSAGGRGVCTSGNPLKCLFTFSGTQRPRFHSRVFFFLWGYQSHTEGELRFATSGRREAQPRCCSWKSISSRSSRSHCSALRWKRRWGRVSHSCQPPSYSRNKLATQPFGHALATECCRILADCLSCWHSEIPLVCSCS